MPRWPCLATWHQWAFGHHPLYHLCNQLLLVLFFEVCPCCLAFRRPMSFDQGRSPIHHFLIASRIYQGRRILHIFDRQGLILWRNNHLLSPRQSYCRCSWSRNHCFLRLYSFLLAFCFCPLLIGNQELCLSLWIKGLHDGHRYQDVLANRY